jgi:hypothetical protein
MALRQSYRERVEEWKQCTDPVYKEHLRYKLDLAKRDIDENITIDPITMEGLRNDLGAYGNVYAPDSLKVQEKQHNFAIDDVLRVFRFMS